MIGHILSEGHYLNVFSKHFTEQSTALENHSKYIIKITANTSQNVSLETYESVRPRRLFSTIHF